MPVLSRGVVAKLFYAPAAAAAACRCLLLLIAKTCCSALDPKRWSPSWVYPVEVLHHLLGTTGEQHVLAAAASSKQQQAADAPKVLATTTRLKTGIQVAQTDWGAKPHHHKQVSWRFKPSSWFYGPFSVQKWPLLGCFRPFSGRSS